MTNADKFKAVFGIYSEEFWAKPEGDMLNWINLEYQEPKSKANVQPVKHGKWILDYGVPWNVIECSECGEKWHHWQGHAMPNYCSNCGAKMDGAE